MNRIARAIVALSLIGASMTAATPSEAAGVPLSGHRGATGVSGVPEHSIESVRYAASHGGYAIEGDVRWTRDGRRVMMHDATLDRTTRCTGSVESKTFAEIRACASSEVVPQFKYWLMEATRQGLRVNPELKTVPTAAQAKQFAADINAYAPSYVVVSSNIPAALAAVKPYLGTRVKYSPIVYAANSKFGYSVAAHRAVGTVVMPDYRTLTPAKVDAYHAAGVKVWGWPAKNATDVAILRNLGVDVIVVDDVARF